ncbi:unnamed protein product, partial [Rotaria magnacalcarata]
STIIINGRSGGVASGELSNLYDFMVVGRYTNSTPAFDDPSSIAFDSRLNLYVASSNNYEVLKYERL